jgi:hypothetical protein
MAHLLFHICWWYCFVSFTTSAFTSPSAAGPYSIGVADSGTRTFQGGLTDRVKHERRLVKPLLAMNDENFMSSFLISAAGEADSQEAVEAATNAMGGLSSDTVNILVFIVGVIPFAIATNEFWRRIAVGEPFGTGSDSVVIIGEDNNPQSSRGRQTLGKGAIYVAYVLFAVAAFSIGVAIVSVVSSPSFEGATPPS